METKHPPHLHLPVAVPGGADVEGGAVFCLCMCIWVSLSQTLWWMCHNVAPQESLVGRLFLH